MSACGIDWCNDGCGQWWVDLEVVQFYLKGRSLPPLVTTSTDPLDEGVLGRPTTQVIFGDDTIGSQRQTGGRVTIGKWLDPQSTLGIGAKFFGMEGDRTSFSAASTGTTVIARPFFNADPIVNAEDSFLISAPGIASGTLNIQTSSDLINAEAYVRYLLLEGGNYRLDAIGGYHFNRLDDGLVIRHSSTSLPPNGPPPIGSTFDVQDVFETTNEFHGGELGLLGEWHCGCVTVSLLGKVSLGNIRQQVAISGSSLVSDGAGGTVNYVGGLLAQPQDNIGVFQHDETGFIPEVGLNLSYALTQHIDVTVGYTFMHWNSVALAGDQIDTTVNASQLSGGTLVGPVRPTFAEFQETSFFLHGINVGIGGRF